jgi:hypothetical protein
MRPKPWATDTGRDSAAVSTAEGKQNKIKVSVLAIPLVLVVVFERVEANCPQL